MTHQTNPAVPVAVGTGMLIAGVFFGGLALLGEDHDPLTPAAISPAVMTPTAMDRHAGIPNAPPFVTAVDQGLENLPYNGDFTFVRIRFTSGGGGGFGRGGGGGFGGRGRGQAPWAHDYPDADYNFVKILDEVTGLEPNTYGSNVIDASDPELMRFPVAYISEPGRWAPTGEDLDNLRNYLKKGGFLILDDFRGEREWSRVELIFDAILPDHRFVELELEEPIFHSFFDVESLDFQPPTFQQYKPLFLGLHQDNDPNKRLMVIANFNNDIGDYWEYSDQGYYPIDLSNEAYKVGVNYVIYALTR